MTARKKIDKPVGLSIDKGKEIYAAIAVCIQAGVPCIAVGKPGVGKTKGIEAIVESLNLATPRDDGQDQWVAESFIAGIHEPADCAGFPVPNRDLVRPMAEVVSLILKSFGRKEFQVLDKMIMDLPQANQKLDFLGAPFAQRAKERADKGLHTFIFIDEMSDCPPAMQAAIMRPVLEGWVGSVQLPREFVRWGAAMNPPEMSANGHDLRPTLANRHAHFAWPDSDVERWCHGMVAGWPAPSVPVLPAKWEAEIPQMRALLASWIRVSRGNYHTMTEANQSGAWASPRTLDMTARLLAANRSIGGDDVDALGIALMSACIGDGPTLEWIAFRRDLDLPDPEELLKNPKSFKIPEGRDDKCYAILSGAVAAFFQKATVARWTQVMRLLIVAYDQGAIDVATALAYQVASQGRNDMILTNDDIPDEIQKFLQVMEEAGVS